MRCTQANTILLFGLSPEDRQAVDAANRRTGYHCFETGCVTDLLAVPHLALVADPTALSQKGWVELMDYYRQVPEDGAKVFFTRPMLVPPDVTAGFRFPVGIKDLQWQLTGHLYRHAKISDDSGDREQDLRRILWDYAKQYKYIFLLCFYSSLNHLSSLHSVARELHRPFICDERYGVILEVASRHSRGAPALYDFDHVLTYSDELLPLMEEKGFFMPVRVRQGLSPVLERFNNDDSLLLSFRWRGSWDWNAAVTQLDQYPDMARLVTERTHLEYLPPVHTL